jgi:hypothetical protein
MGIALSSVSALLAQPPARLSASTSRLSRLREFKGITLTPFFPEPPRGDVDFSPLVLATRDFASRRVELTYSYLTNPRDARGQRGVESSQYVTIVRLSISRAHCVVLSRVSRAQLLHFTTSLPEALPLLYPNTRNVEISISSLPLIATRYFETFGTEVSASYPPICQNGEFSTRRQRGSHDGTSLLFGISDFPTS